MLRFSARTPPMVEPARVTCSLNAPRPGFAAVNGRNRFGTMSELTANRLTIRPVKNDRVSIPQEAQSSNHQTVPRRPPWRNFVSRSSPPRSTVEPGSAPGTPLRPFGGDVVTSGGMFAPLTHHARYVAVTLQRGARSTTQVQHGSSPTKYVGCTPDVTGVAAARAGSLTAAVSLPGAAGGGDDAGSSLTGSGGSSAETLARAVTHRTPSCGAACTTAVELWSTGFAEPASLTLAVIISA